MSTISRTKTWVTGDTLTASDLNAEFDAILTDYNGAISNANIASDAAIASTKISGTAATLAGSETLSNKTLTKPVVNGSVQAFTTDSDGTTVTFDMSASNVHSVTLAGNRTLAVSNVSVGQAFVIRLIQDATGSRTVTWWSTIKWGSGTAPTLTTTANAVDVLGFICTSSGNYDGYVVGMNLS